MDIIYLIFISILIFCCYKFIKAIKSLENYIKVEEVLQKELITSLDMELPVDLTNEKVRLIIDRLDTESAGDVLEILFETPKLPDNVIRMFK